MSLILSNIWRVILALIIQIIILNNVDQLGLGNSFIIPQIYVIIILVLPFEMPTWASIIIGFIVGLLIDYSLNSMGLHTFASTTLAYLKPRLTKSLSPRDGYDFNSEPGLRDQGFQWAFVYFGIGTLVHHFCLFFLEKLSWSNFFTTLGTVVLSSAFTLILLFIFQLVVNPKKKV